MPGSLFRYILAFSRRQQLLLTVFTLLSFPFLYVSLELPKRIINDAIGGAGAPYRLLDREMSQISYLLVLSFVFLALVFVNGGFKYAINVYRGVMAERMLRRLRYMLFERVTRFPLPHFRKTGQGEIVSMITAEAEPLGGFFGEAISLPLYQGGVLLTILTFIFVQNPWMGTAAIALYPVQAYLIPKLQRRVNELGKARVRTVRKLSEHIGETVSGAQDIRANATAGLELARFTKRLGQIFIIRKEIYQRKFFIKFLNNFIAQVTPFFFYSVGGYLVIVGELSFGALVAALAAYKDLAAPWKELLAYYQRLADARIKYDQLVDQFDPPGMAPPRTPAPASIAPLSGPIAAAGVSVADEDGIKAVDNVTLSLRHPGTHLLTGGNDSGKSELAQLFARLLSPDTGTIRYGPQNLAELPDGVLGRRLGYVGAGAHLFKGSIADNLLYGLKQRPVAPYANPGDDDDQHRQEIALSGNSPEPLQANWIDYEAAGVHDRDGLDERLLAVLADLAVDEDVYRIGLQRRLDPDPELATAVLTARRLIRERLSARGMDDLIEGFDPERYNDNATILENLLFGTPADGTLGMETLAAEESLRAVLRRHDLRDTFVNMGRQALHLTLELFADLPPGHEFFERYSFVSADDLPRFKQVLRRTDGIDPADMDKDDRIDLTAVAFQLTPSRHRLGLMDDGIRDRILAARHSLRDALPGALARRIALFDAEGYTAAASVLDNLLFGRFAYGRAHSEERVGRVIVEVVRETGLFARLVALGLDAEVGIGGSRLSPALRQKIALARVLLKQPDMLIIDEALGALDPESRAAVLARLAETHNGRSLLWVDSVAPSATVRFDDEIRMAGGRVRALQTAAGDAPLTDAEPGGLGEEYRLLRGIPLLAGLDPSTLKLLAFTSRRLTFKAGEMLFEQGDSGDAAYLVISGEAEILLTGADGQQQFLRAVAPKEVIGEIALLCDVPRSASIRATEELTVLELTKPQFLDLIAQDQQVALQMVRVLARRVDATTKQLTR